MKDKRKTLDKKEEYLIFKKIAKKQQLHELGITLIALVVTIIILLILAGVTLNIALSDNGLFSKTKEATEKYKQAQKDEELKVEKMEYAIDGKDITKVQEISNKEEFKEFRNNVNKGENFENTLVKLSSDIDLEKEQWEPIGTKNNPFNGVFNGNEHEIKNLSFGETNEEEYLGLFGYNEGIIKNVGIADCNITCTLLNESAIVGFLAGENSGIIEKCYNKSDGVFTGGSKLGGIVGELSGEGSISKCYNKGNLTFYPKVEFGGACGIAGRSWDGVNIFLCYNNGNITVYGSNTNQRVSGISDGEVYVESCYNTGDMIYSDSDEIDKEIPWPVSAGIIAQLDASVGYIKNCYNIGKVELNSQLKDYVRIGYIVGYFGEGNLILENNYYLERNKDITGLGWNDGGIEVTNEKIKKYESEDELKKIAGLLGDDYKEDTKGINVGFPILAWQDK